MTHRGSSLFLIICLLLLPRSSSFARATALSLRRVWQAGLLSVGSDDVTGMDRKDEMGLEWELRFGLRGKGGRGGRGSTASQFTAARGGGGGGGGHPFGLGIGKTLYDAVSKNDAFASTELRTEDTEQGGRIFGAPIGVPLEDVNKKATLTGLEPSKDFATAQNLTPMEEVKEFASTATIAPPADTEAPPKPVRATLLGSPISMHMEGAGQYIPITMTSPEFKR